MIGTLWRLLALVIVELAAIIALVVLLSRGDMSGAMLALVGGMVLGAIIGPTPDECAALSDLCEQQRKG